jgi:suppressor for copper-sensitivity B
MGFGMAIPYLIFAVFPSAITLLPKPGAWMVRVKQALGFVMILAAIWLVWVLSMQAGDLSAIVVIITALILIIKLKVLKNHPLFSRGSVILTVAIFAALFNVLLANKLNDSRMSSAALSGAGFWKEFNQQEIESLVAAGNVVFVDVTADWCITCKVNKAFFVESEDVIEAMNKPNIVAMQADWTNRNEEIAQYLQSFGRYGIPFNVVYGPGAPEGIILPELLSKSVVIEALKKAEGE